LRRLILTVLVALSVFDVLATLANGRNEVTNLDRDLSATCEEWAKSTTVADFFRNVTSFGDAEFLTLVALMTTLALVLRGQRRLALLWMLVTVSAGLMDGQLKRLVGRPRPQFVTPLVKIPSASFPSGHAFGSAVVYGLLAVLLRRWVPGKLGPILGVLSLLLVAAIGVSRVVIGAHWPSDVAAGFAVGFAWVAVWAAPFDMLNRLSEQHGDQ
jgi:undecaprenyl-diphosphatase